MARARTTTGARVRGRLAAIGVIAALAVILTPGAAAATPTGTVRGFIDCFTYNRDGSFTLVVGYENTYGHPVDIPRGTRNRMLPSRIEGTPPTQFSAGTVHAAFRVEVTFAQLWLYPRWEIDGNVVDYRGVEQYSSACPPGTQLPAEGNGTGTAVALGAAGAVGAAAIFRFRRRIARSSG